MRPRPLLLLLMLSLAAANAACAEDIHDLQVSGDGGRYRVSFDATLDAPVDRARPYMLEPRQWPQLSEIVTEAHVLAPLADGGHIVHVTLSACVLFFCKTIQKLEEMRQLPDGDIVTSALPGRGDFHYARERWRVSGDAHRTRVQYDAEFVPAFFVPPVIGPYLLKRELEGLLSETARNLERLAGAGPPATPAD